MPRRSAVRLARVGALLDDVDRWITVRGASMQPALPAGTRVRLAPAGDRWPRPGDVVVYAEPDRLVCHRVLWRRGRRVLVAGDAAGSRAVWVGAHRLLARVAAIERPGDAIIRTDGVAAAVEGTVRAARALVRLAAVRLADASLARRRAFVRAVAR